MADFQHIKCKQINRKCRKIDEISHPISKWESVNRTVVSKFRPEDHK